MRKKILVGALCAINDRVNTVYGERKRMPCYLQKMRSRVIKKLLPGDKAK